MSTIRAKDQMNSKPHRPNYPSQGWSAVARFPQRLGWSVLLDDLLRSIPQRFVIPHIRCMAIQARNDHELAAQASSFRGSTAQTQTSITP